MVGRVSLKGLYSRASFRGLSWGEPNMAQRTVQGIHNLGSVVTNLYYGLLGPDNASTYVLATLLQRAIKGSSVHVQCTCM